MTVEKTRFAGVFAYFYENVCMIRALVPYSLQVVRDETIDHGSQMEHELL